MYLQLAANIGQLAANIGRDRTSGKSSLVPNPPPSPPPLCGGVKEGEMDSTCSTRGRPPPAPLPSQTRGENRSRRGNGQLLNPSPPPPPCGLRWREGGPTGGRHAPNRQSATARQPTPSTPTLLPAQAPHLFPAVTANFWHGRAVEGEAYRQDWC